MEGVELGEVASVRSSFLRLLLKLLHKAFWKQNDRNWLARKASKGIGSLVSGM